MPNTEPIILFEDASIIVCIKPAGIASQSAKSFNSDMTDILKRHIMKTSSIKTVPEIYVVHRLDQPVGGIMVYAKTKTAAANLSRQTREHTMAKCYLAVVSGTFSDKSGTLNDFLLKDERSNTSSVVKEGTPGSKKASLEYDVISERTIDDEVFSLLKVTLHTGRHHQIRVQFSHAGHPLLGDLKYSGYAKTAKGTSTLGLFSCSLEFVHPTSGKPVSFEYTPDYEPFIP